MTNDYVPTHQPIDDDSDRRRRERFGKLPERIPTAELVEVVEAEPARETHEPIEPRREWG